MRITAKELAAVVDEAMRTLPGVSEHEASLPALDGGWSRKQVIGHLIDSASNNHQRFVRAALDGSVDFPGYDQNSWARVQACDDAPWPMLIDTWASMNRLLSHVLAHIPEEAGDAPCRIGGAAPMPLRALARDYLVHLRHHLDQIRPGA